MNTALIIVLAGGLGLLIGHLHFALLRRAVDRWARGSVHGFLLQRAACTLGSAAVLALVALTAGLPPLAAAAVGFLLARTIHLRRGMAGGNHA